MAATAASVGAVGRQKVNLAPQSWKLLPFPLGCAGARLCLVDAVLRTRNSFLPCALVAAAGSFFLTPATRCLGDAGCEKALGSVRPLPRARHTPERAKAILDARGVDYTGVIEKELLEQKVRDSEPTAKKAKAAMKRPSRAAAVASSKAWKDNIKSYNNNRFGDSGDEDDYEDEGPSAAARSKKAKANGGTKKRKRPKDNSDDDFSDNFSAVSESEDPGSESEAQASDSEDSEEDFDSDEFDSEDDERRQRGEAEPPADTRPEAAAAAAIAALKQRRKDLKGKMIKAQVRAEAIGAAQEAHAACLKSKGRRVARELIELARHHRVLPCRGRGQEGPARRLPEGREGAGAQEALRAASGRGGD